MCHLNSGRGGDDGGGGVAEPAELLMSEGSTSLPAQCYYPLLKSELTPKQLSIQVEAETTVEGVLQNLKNYQPPMLKREELRGKKGKDDDFNGSP